jgi:hypothetical protein
MGYGREGFVWMAGELTRQRDNLMQAYQSNPSEDLHKVIDQLAVKIADIQRELRNTKDLSLESEKIAGASCSICYSATADGYPLSGAAGQGVGAIADSSFSSNCGYFGDTYAYAYAQATLNGTTTTHTQTDGPHTGTSTTSHAAATVNGNTSCSSTANSYATSTALGISYSTSDSNTSCPPPPPTVTISSTTPVSISGTSCQTITWTSSVSGGSSPFSYAWTIDGVATGTSSSTSVSKSYCGNNTTHSQTVNVALNVTDSASQTGSKTFATTINYTAVATGPTVTISGPASITKFTGLCKAGTWTAAATGGTTPYTNYAWTLNGFAVGTNSSTLTQTFCPEDIETVTVGVTVTDSASHTGSATFSTWVDVEGQLCGQGTGVTCN